MSVSAFPYGTVAGGGGIAGNLSDIGTLYTDESNLTTTYELEFRFVASSADVQVTRAVENPPSETVQTDFTTDTAGTWVRLTTVSGSAFNGGLTPGTWYQCNVNRSFSLSYTSSGGSDFLNGVLRFDLASDSGGSTIIATSADISWRVGEEF